MAKNLKINLADLSDEDLQQKLKDSQGLVKQHAFNHVITPLDNPMQIRNERREVARILTEINKRKATAQAK
jgi:large subunit ribosomal protein L29